MILIPIDSASTKSWIVYSDLHVFPGHFRISGGHPSSAASHCDTHLSGEIFGPQVFEAAGLSSHKLD